MVPVPRFVPPPSLPGCSCVLGKAFDGGWVVHSEVCQEGLEVGDRDRDVAGLDPVDLRQRPEQVVGHLLLCEPLSVAGPAKGQTQATTGDGRGLGRGHGFIAPSIADVREVSECHTADRRAPTERSPRSTERKGSSRSQVRCDSSLWWLRRRTVAHPGRRSAGPKTLRNWGQDRPNRPSDPRQCAMWHLAL